ncbi:NACHT domain-containing protein [Actinosynnema sp. NPDC020468]|uniref:NACHT domain-containing protein n=1 Tax=Actinosynnema sp. NPDC020468 TaxID=3154488 RepID=UPI0033FC047D
MIDPLTTVLGATFSALHQWALGKLVDGALSRRGQRLGSVERQVAAAAADLAELRAAEFPALTDADWEAVVGEVATTLLAASIGRVAQLEPQVVVDAATLRARLRPAPDAGLGEAAGQAYRRLLHETCEQIAQQARQVDSIWRSAVARGGVDLADGLRRSLDGLHGLKLSVTDLAEAPVRRDRDERSRFERRYLAEVSRAFARFELFQAGGQIGGPAKHDFGTFYSPPSIDRWQRRSDVELTGQGVNGAHTVTAARRVLLFGRAGAGKTTFLHWLAHVTAQAGRQPDPDSAWRDVVPFFVPLRQYADRDLPLAEDLVQATAPALAGEKPERWVTGLLAEGRALLLVDGVDELLREGRDRARTWLEGLVRNYPDAWYVVTTRPSAVDETWLAPTEDGEPGLARFELMPLSGPGVQDLVGNWFGAVRQNEPESAHDWLRRCEHKLKDALQNRPDVLKLVSSPLLCSLLCALYRRENMYLPHSRKDLLGRALELLLGEWDVRRGVPVDAALRMTGNEKVVLLERFAAPMVRNGEHVVTEAAARRRIERAMTGLRSTDLDPPEVLRHLVERTGLLRDDEGDGGIRFVHRIFRDFLAAGEFVKSGDLAYLVENAHDAAKELDEVIFMAAAQARAHEAGDLLHGLLERARRRSLPTAQAHRLRLLAAASLGYVDVIEPERVRADVVDTVRDLVPPRGYDDAELLARAGSFVPELLPDPVALAEQAELTGADPAELARYVIRTLAVVGDWGSIQPFTRAYGAAVTNELLRAWRNTEYSDTYAAENLGLVDFGDRELEVHRWHMLCGLRHLRTLTRVVLVGDLQLADPRAGLRPLADLPRLTRLEIRSNQVCRSLDGLLGTESLRTVVLSVFSALEDLSALARLPVTTLNLVGVPFPGGPVAKLATLDGAHLTSLTVKHPDLAHGLHTLPASLPLEHLSLKSRSNSVEGVSRFPALRTVSVLGGLTPAEAEELAGLPNLESVRLDVTAADFDPSALEVLAEVDVVVKGAVAGTLPPRVRVDG